MTEPISVTALNQYVKGLLDRDRLLTQVLVRGEISNFKRYPSGHCYFSLKDAESSLRCVLFRREASALRFQPENGMQVVAAGRVSLFPRDGSYQLYCTRLVPDGVGELALAFEQLKNRLYQEGLFDQSHKKPLPAFPGTIALVTSPAGAAVRDMIRILGVRWPMARVLVVPVHVQGEEAPGELQGAVALVNAMDLADLIIVGRGGGSMEDLWAFNDEGLARAIYASKLPVISAVGHEPDVTIADLVADVRASTPSNGAELAVPDQTELRERLSQLGIRMEKTVQQLLRRQQERLERAERSPFLQLPNRAIQEKRLLLDYQQQRLAAALDRRVQGERQRLSGLAASLEALSPFKVLARGYSMTQKKDGVAVSSIQQVAVGETLTIKVADGAITCTAAGKEKHRWRKRS